MRRDFFAAVLVAERFFAARPRASNVQANMMAKISVVFGNKFCSERNHATSKVKVAKPEINMMDIIFAEVILNPKFASGFLLAQMSGYRRANTNAKMPARILTAAIIHVL